LGKEHRWVSILDGGFGEIYGMWAAESVGRVPGRLREQARDSSVDPWYRGGGDAAAMSARLVARRTKPG